MNPFETVAFLQPLCRTVRAYVIKHYGDPTLWIGVRIDDEGDFFIATGYVTKHGAALVAHGLSAEGFIEAVEAIVALAEAS